jgi:hypothetical protein
MVARVRLEGLQIFRARGKWYVYRRATGEPLIRGFAGDRADLDREMAKADFVTTYNRPRRRHAPASELGSDTLGGFINWFTNGDIDRTAEQRKAEDRFGDNPEGYPKWRTKLAAATRKDYLECLSEEFLNHMNHL